MNAPYRIPDAALAQHTAILGKTGSGKTSTAKLAVEQVVAEDFRVCVLDPIKSDWWGITSSASGKKAGLPFRILGGPHGHVPLPSSAGAAIGQLVGSGQLPLSIIDMADFEAGGLQRFFVDFAPALMRSARGVVYLVVEEAHEFAPKERSGVGAENMAIHWAKKLATAGRSKGIRLIVGTQRVQSLHNAILGSCETVITHRLTTPADQEPVLKWMKANADKTKQEEVAGSLSSLPTGSGWICSGEARIFERVEFPKFATFDNTATPLKDGEQIDVKMAPVDREALKAIIGDSVKEAEANDPKVLRKEIARLERELVAKPKAAAPAGPTAEDLARARAEGERVGISIGLSRARSALDGLRVEEITQGQAAPPAARPPPAPPSAPAATRSPAAPPRQAAEPADGVSAPQQRILNALAWWSAFGIDGPTNEQVGFIAGYAPWSGNFNNLKGGMRGAGLIDYPAGGKISLTPAGAARAATLDLTPSKETFHLAVRQKLSGPQVRLLDPVLAVYPAALSTEQLAAEAGYAAGSGNFNNLRGSLRAIGLIDYPAPGAVRAADWHFPGAR